LSIKKILKCLTGNPYLKKNYIYDDNLKSYPLTGKYFELKNEKPYNIVILSDILNKNKFTTNYIKDKDTNFNLDNKIHDDNLSSIKSHRKLKIPLSAKNTNSNYSILKDCPSKKPLYIKSNEPFHGINEIKLELKKKKVIYDPDMCLQKNSKEFYNF